MKGKIFFLGVLVVLIAAFLGAHDFWLVPQKFMLNPNDSLTISANTGMDFPNSLSAIDPARFTQFTVTGKSGKTDISKFEIEGNSLTTEITLEKAGTYIVAAALKSKEIKLTAEEFNEYLLHDGLPQIYELRKQEGILEQAAVEYYSKYPKSILQVGKQLDETPLKPIGLVIEIVPLINPYALKRGENLPIKVLLRGEPLKNAEVAWGYPGLGEKLAGSVKTDSEGKAVVPLVKAGPYLIRTIHMEWVKKETHDWESYWTSLTFEVLNDN